MRSFKIYGIWPQARTYVNTLLQCSPASVGLAQARPNDKHMIILYHPLMQLLDGSTELAHAHPQCIHLVYRIMWVTCCVCAVAKCGVFRHFPRYDEHMIILYHALMQLLDGSTVFYTLTVCVFPLYPTMWVSPTAADTCSKKKSPNYDTKLMFHHPGEPE